MKQLRLFLSILSLSIPQAFAQEDNLKTIIKDNGAKEREQVDARKECLSVMADQQKLMVMIRPEFTQKVTLKEAVILEVFRSDNSVGHAAKCVFKFPIK